MEEMFAIKCQNCGGPMYSHQATRSFDCAYCGTSVPWEAGGQQPADTVGIRHQPIQMVDGLMKLTHVSQLEPRKMPIGTISSLTGATRRCSSGFSKKTEEPPKSLSKQRM